MRGSLMEFLNPRMKLTIRYLNGAPLGSIEFNLQISTASLSALCLTLVFLCKHHQHANQASCSQSLPRISCRGFELISSDSSINKAFLINKPSRPTIAFSFRTGLHKTFAMIWLVESVAFLFNGTSQTQLITSTLRFLTRVFVSVVLRITAYNKL